MSKASRNAVRQVLKEAAEHERFFDLSDAERLKWMIALAFQLGRRQANPACPPPGWPGKAQSHKKGMQS